MSSEVAVEIHGGRWKRYPAYRDSGVEWLGEVPEGSKIKALKRTFKTLNGSTPKSGEIDYWNGDIHWATPDDLGQLKTNTLQITQRMLTKEGYSSCGTSLAPSGSLILSTRAPIGHLAIAGTTMCTNQGCRCLVFRADDDSHYFYYQLLAARSELESLGQGSTFKELSRGNLEDTYLITPTLSEQRAIAAFLDRKTGRIDTLFEKKERQVELLQEKRAALISHAVTKGLDPDVKMKDSGVEWLGEVPEGWEMLALKRLASLKSGESITAESIDKDGDYPVFGGNGLRGYTTTFTHDGNYVLIGRQGALCGNINYAQGQFWASEHAVVVSPIGPVETKWLGELLRAMNLNQYSVSAAQPGLSVEMVSNLSIPQPPLQEQSTIAAFLNRETGCIDSLLKKIHESISKLREYRTALISAAVTGKIDVREDLVS